MAVYPVREDTLLVKENLENQELESEKFLEIGVGNGEVALTAAKKDAKVTGTDINPEAIEHTRRRFDENNLDGEFYESDLFENVKGEYCFIVFNPPYLKGENGIGDEEMWRGGETGLETAKKFLEKVSDYLIDGGRAWIVLSSQTDYREPIEKFDLEKVDTEKIWFERLYLMEF